MTEPTTEAGKDLQERLLVGISYKQTGAASFILDIEAEALANERQRIAAALRDWVKAMPRDEHIPVTDVLRIVEADR